MLKIIIPKKETYNEETNEFIISEEKELILEHSLLSISKWEEKHHKAFISKEHHSQEEMLDYIKCMTLTQNVNDNVYSYLTQDNINEIQKYISDQRTSLIFSDEKGSTSNKSLPNEKLYYYMFALNIPMECQKWHVNHLIALIKFINEMNQPKKKRLTSEDINRRKALNEARRLKLNSKG